MKDRLWRLVRALRNLKGSPETPSGRFLETPSPCWKDALGLVFTSGLGASQETMECHYSPSHRAPCSQLPLHASYSLGRRPLDLSNPVWKPITAIRPEMPPWRRSATVKQS